MTFRDITLLSFIITCDIAYSQAKHEPVVSKAVDKGDYFYIPKALLSDSVDGILYPDEMLKETNADKRIIELYWGGSSCNDGSYNLIITPEQIFLSSFHENPNPNFLFWTIGIDSIQYKQILYGLKHKPSNTFEDLSANYNNSRYVFFDKKYKDTFRIPEEWTDEMMRSLDKYCEQQIKAQVAKYFSILNSYINKGKKIAPPTDEERIKIKPKFFSAFEKELHSWVNHEF